MATVGCYENIAPISAVGTCQKNSDICCADTLSPTMEPVLPTSQAAPPLQNRPTEALTALILDADVILRDAVELYCSTNAALAATVAASAPEAWQLLNQHHYDAVVLEINFPDFEAFLHECTVRERVPALIVLVPLTETMLPDRFTPAVQLLLTKPLPPLLLHRAIELCVGYRQLEEQHEALHQRQQTHLELVRQCDSLVQRIRQLEHQLSEHQRRFHIAIHDLQNPLANLLALLGELHHRAQQLPTAAQESIALCLHSAETMQALVEDLLSAAQLDQQPNLSYQPLDLAQLLRSTARRFTAAAERKNIWINVLAPPELPPLWADEHQLRKALDNLVSNAIKYTPSGGAVTLEVEKKEMTIAIHVRDTGLGMTPEDIAAAFQEFTRLSATPTGDEPSTGLGLYIVRRIAELHHGSVRASSEGKGRGSTFTLELPIEPPHESHSSAVVS